MVAMLGAIMPLPLPMAPTVQVLPPSSNWMAYSFLWVSVVMMAVAASVLPCAVAASFSAAAGMPRAKGSQHSSASATPLAAQVLALPLFTRMACA